MTAFTLVGTMHVENQQNGAWHLVESVPLGVTHSDVDACEYWSVQPDVRSLYVGAACSEIYGQPISSQLCDVMAAAEAEYRKPQWRLQGQADRLGYDLWNHAQMHVLLRALSGVLTIREKVHNSRRVKLVLKDGLAVRPLYKAWIMSPRMVPVYDIFDSVMTIGGS